MFKEIVDSRLRGACPHEGGGMARTEMDSRLRGACPHEGGGMTRTEMDSRLHGTGGRWIVVAE